MTSDEIGAFNDDTIADLYIKLRDWGLASEEDALLVGGFIEEYDILDIWKAYDETDEERIKRVYQNLYEGSYNHLDAFVFNYELSNISSNANGTAKRPPYSKGRKKPGQCKTFD